MICESVAWAVGRTCDDGRCLGMEPENGEIICSGGVVVRLRLRSMALIEHDPHGGHGGHDRHDEHYYPMECLRPLLSLQRLSLRAVQALPGHGTTWRKDGQAGSDNL